MQRRYHNKKCANPHCHNLVVQHGKNKKYCKACTYMKMGGYRLGFRHYLKRMKEYAKNKKPTL